jgi:hypothetical protein
MTRPDPPTAESAREAGGDDRLLTTPEAAALLGRSESWVCRHAEELGGRKGKRSRIANPWLFEPGVVERELVRRKAEAARRKAEAEARERRREEKHEAAARARREAAERRNRESAQQRRERREREAAERAARMEARERAEQARRTAAWKAKPWPTVSARDVDWRSLSPAGCETLAMTALPVAAGLTHAEVAVQAGLSLEEVTRRMRKLRQELEAQVAAKRTAKLGPGLGPELRKSSRTQRT